MQHTSPYYWAIESELGVWVRRALTELGLIPNQSSTEPQVDWTIPQRAEHGDWTTNIALQLFSKKADWETKTIDTALQEVKSPRALAEVLAAKMREVLPASISRVEVAGPGFINVFVSDSVLAVSAATLRDADWATILQSSHPGTVVVEYSSPNIAKPFTIGHLRSTIIGDVIANVLQAQGHDVRRDNHLGDWGTQFGKLVYAIKTWGNEDAIAQSERPIKDLVDLYVLFHAKAEEDPELVDHGRAWFKKLEEGDEEARRIWKKCIDWSWKEFDAIYQRLGVHFTENDGRGYGESYFEEKMDVVIEELRQKKLLTQSEGAQLVFFPDEKLPPLMIVQKSGSTLYATRDLATDRWRLFEKYGPKTRIINEVGAEQSLYFKQIFEIEQMLGWVEPGQRVHIGHGLYRFADRKMSTRKGNVIWLEEVLDEAERRAQELIRQNQKDENDAPADLAQAVSIGAIKWNDLKRSAHLDITFDWDEMLSMDGNSGPYMQYSYVRTVSLLEKARQADDSEFLAYDADWIESLSDEERQLVQLLVQYPLVITQTADQYAPHVLCTYLYTLAQAFNTFYAKSPVLLDGKVHSGRLVLVQVTNKVLDHGLSLLGIERVSRM